jgi:hypothetical protein
MLRASRRPFEKEGHVVDDYSQFKGSAPASPLSERVWGVQKKRKVTDRNPQNGRKPQRDSAGKPKGEGQEQGLEAGEEAMGKTDLEEEIGYGSHKIRKKSNRQVDMVV